MVVKVCQQRNVVPYNPRPRWGLGGFGRDTCDVMWKAPMGLLFFWTGAIYWAGVFREGLWGPFLLEGRVETALHDRFIALL